VRYYDLSPWYGLGLGERRYGNFLHNKNRDDYVLSSKVGKLLKASSHSNAKSNFPFSPSPNNVVFDYTADGASFDCGASAQCEVRDRLVAERRLHLWQPAVQLWQDVPEHFPPVPREAGEAARPWRRSSPPICEPLRFSSLRHRTSPRC
jgi:hypothetical protein